MAVLNKLVLLALCAFAYSLPQNPDTPTWRNTIFVDETLEGQAFEDLVKFGDVQLSRDSSSPYRLPTTTKPDHYNIRWNFNMVDRSFTGEVAINLFATQAGVNSIVIHADDMNIEEVVLRLGTNVVPTNNYVLNPTYQTMTITLTSGTLQYNAANSVFYTLTIKFNAKLRKDMSGIYESWFRNTHNQQQVSWMASTQFQATAARYAFPCYDEPSFKATFDVTIRRPTSYSSWFNTRLSNTVNNVAPGFADDVYTRTPRMSTYLLALIVAEYKTVADGTPETLKYEVIARPGAIDDGQGQYAYNVGKLLLGNMSLHTGIDFYGVSQNLKMTQASIPDFSAGAMENWGLLTYREAYLMYHPTETNGYYKQIIAYILSHEITHMWYGNLVTCDWWDVLWLNEGFARYYQYFLTSWVEDKMGFETRFIVEQVHTVLLTDSANNPQPLTNPGVGSPSAVSAMFSTVSYNKGAAIIRQTEHLLGTSVNRQGLEYYLIEKSLATAKPIDLFNSLKKAGDELGALSAYGSSFDFVEYYKSWTEQPGHPVLNVQVNHKTGDMTITQRRFNINTGYSSINTNYIVPVTFATASNPSFSNTKPTHIIDSTTTIINHGSTGDQWVIFNKQQTGYYRVNYDDYTWNLNTLALRGAARTQIHEYNRAQIVNDVFQFARSGLMTYKKAFTILSFLEFETSYAPWVAAMTGFSWIRNRYAGTPFLAQIETMIRRWATAVMADLSYDPPTANEDFMRSYLRYQLAPVMCAMGDTTCKQAARTQFNNMVNNVAPVHPDNRNWVYCNALREGNEADFTYLWTRFQQHNVYTEKILLLTVLGCTSHAASLRLFLKNIIDETYVIRSQDYTTAWSSAVSGNEENTDIVFEFIKENLDDVVKAFGSASTPLSYVAARLRSEAAIDAYQTWARNSQAALGSSFQAVINSAESTRESIRWATTNQQDLTNYINNGNDPLETTTSAPAGTTPSPVTTQQPNLIEPSTPAIPDSAISNMFSLVVLTFALVAQVLL